VKSAKRQDANEMERRAAVLVLGGGLNGTYARTPKTQDEKNLAQKAKYAAISQEQKNARKEKKRLAKKAKCAAMHVAGPGNNPVQGFRT
jgi:hypothetical protein